MRTNEAKFWGHIVPSYLLCMANINGESLAEVDPGNILTRDSKGISELPQIKLNLPYKISCIRVSLYIPLISLAQGSNWDWLVINFNA